MLVTGAPKATIACLLGGQRLVWCDVERDEETIRRIIYHGERFWRAVQERTPPAPDGTESAKRALEIAAAGRYWQMAKGKIRDSEPLYGAAILDTVSDKVIMIGEADDLLGAIASLHPAIER